MFLPYLCTVLSSLNDNLLYMTLSEPEKHTITTIRHDGSTYAAVCRVLQKERALFINGGTSIV